ncbi:MAG: bifunctional 5,10-methylenetetrahydrofolate dehydrogenase/5,10-methenyltetrahydrofolate cyclohydrolase [Treponema sp.]|jgi:methylenetetrahydrofolate dehydrogenase (NADP+)/methenyltetrahydrofolate cyclohydrolase|nr:bifunctional 5,10-methylenetetrahydrofolate dehydrogenase/5,10-methenyltetrahydrofolate cyclohydrolase [Treponema sp.]
MAMILDGTQVAHTVRQQLRARIATLDKKGIIPCLGVILVGENPASVSYVKSKEKALAAESLASKDVRLPSTATEAEVLTCIRTLNEDPTVHGILVQLPLPPHIRSERIIEAIKPEKDVDGLHPLSLGNIVRGQPSFLPCTPAGILSLLNFYRIPTSGAHVVIVGRSLIVGRPLSVMLSLPPANATVTVCHSKTVDIAQYTRAADILIVAVGKDSFLSHAMVKESATVIDVGINRVPDSTAPRGYRLCGDVNFESVSQKVFAISPVPGGVGPLTIAMLLQNVVRAAEFEQCRSTDC